MQISEDVHRYGPIEGTEALRQELKKKLAQENGITDKEVVVTAGSNQGMYRY